jgi:hypothetical protein
MASSSRADRVHEEPTRPKVLAHKVSLSLSIDPRQVDRALALDVPDDLRHGIFRRNRQKHVHAIGHEMPFLDLRFPLQRELAEHLAQVSAKLPIQPLAPTFRDEDYVIFADPCRVA